MACHCESEGSADGAGKRDAGERGAREEEVGSGGACSVEATENLVSGYYVRFCDIYKSMFAEL
jgi:hypothetical protein